MKLSISITTHLIAFLSMILSSAPVNLGPVNEKVNHCNNGSIEKQDLVIEKPSELLHSEILFRY